MKIDPRAGKLVVFSKIVNIPINGSDSIDEYDLKNDIVNYEL